MKLYVTIADATAMMHTGADIERRTKSFDLPQEVVDFIAKADKITYATISLSLDMRELP